STYGRAAQASEALPQVDQAAGQEQHHHDEQQAKDDVVELRERHGKLFADDDIEGRADQRTKYRSHAADKRDQQCVESPARVERELRVETSLMKSEGCAGQASEQAADGHGC